MRQETLDVLDAYFIDKMSRFKNLLPTDRRAIFTNEFVIDPFHWEEHFPTIQTYNLKWSEFKYNSKPDIDNLITSTDTGIYLFIVKSDALVYDLPKFVIYVGISGENNSNRPLRERLKDYFREKSIKKRDALHRLICNYYNHTYVAYTLVKGTTEELKKLETALISFFYPIANKDDFAPSIKKVEKAFSI